MKEFCYTIKDPVGIHARPAGMLARMADRFESSVTIRKDDTAVELGKLIAVMKLGVSCGDTVTVTVSGSDEKAAADSIKAFFEQAL